jgi:hypothetical protein
MVRAFEDTHRVAFLELNNVSHVPLPPKISDGLGLDLGQISHKK